MPTTNKLFGLADPQYDALRVLSTQALQVGPGDGTSGAGLLENKIYLWPADGSTISTYDPTQAGLIAALAAAVSGDSVWLPSIPIALTTGVTIPAGAALVSMSADSILNFSGFSGAAVTLSAGSIVHRPVVNFVATGSTATGIFAPADNAIIFDPIVNVSGATVTNIAIGIGAAHHADEIWIAGQGLSPTDRFVAWSEDGGTTWHAVAALPTGNFVDFGGYHDGSAIFLKVDYSTVIYKCENPKAGSPTWTQILAFGDEISPGYSIDGQYSAGINSFQIAGDTLYVLATCNGSDQIQFAGKYTLAGGWSWTNISSLDSNAINRKWVLDYFTYMVDAGTYKLMNVIGGTLGYTWNQSTGFSDSSGRLWRNLIGGHYYCERGVNGAPALYYFHDITSGADVIGDVFQTTTGADGYIASAYPRGAWYGPQVYVVDPENGDLYLSEDGADFNVVATWANGIALDDLLAGSGVLYWVRLVLNAEEIRSSSNRGASWSNATGNLWSVIPAAATDLVDTFLVWR